MRLVGYTWCWLVVSSLAQAAVLTTLKDGRTLQVEPVTEVAEIHSDSMQVLVESFVHEWRDMAKLTPAQIHDNGRCWTEAEGADSILHRIFL